MDVLGAADKAYGSHPVPLLVICPLRRLYQTGIIAKPKIVVRAHAQKLSSVLHLHSCPLRRHKRRLAFKKTCLFNSFYFFRIDTQNVVFTCHLNIIPFYI